jgi:hypothetical protein
MHDDQLEISAATVASLIGGQFPQWRSLPVRPVNATGTVNAIFRIGERYAARFPLQGGDADAVRRVLETAAAAEPGCGDLEWARGRAWAFEQAMGLVWYYADSNPVLAAIGRRTLDRLLADEPGR